VQLEKKNNQTECKSRPYMYLLDPGNICNLKCPLCNTGRKNNNQNTEFMPLERYNQILLKIKDHAIMLGLYNWGEPLLNPNIFKFIEIAAQNRIFTFLSTNCNISNLDAEMLVQSGLSYIIIGLDGYDQESYSYYRKKGDLALVLENMRKISKSRKKSNSKLPFIEAQCLIHKNNEKFIKRIRNLAFENGAEFFRTQFLLVDPNDKLAKQFISDSLMNYYKFQNYVKIKRPSCIWLYDNATINPFGNMNLCCYITNSLIGNVMEIPLNKIWNSEFIKQCRKQVYIHNSNKKCEICPFPFHQRFQIKNFLSQGILRKIN
jgi:radical SAM protein with 4Fe4S-binding SPASM domain